MSGAPRPVQVNIAGLTLNIRTDASEKELEAVRSMVENYVEQIRAGARSARDGKVYLLAALAIADELRKTRTELENLRDGVHDTAQQALGFLEQDAGN